jgi:hypothetical protein
MRPPCVLCRSGSRPDAAHLDDEEGGGRLCAGCAGRVMELVCQADERLLAELWLLPLDEETEGAPEAKGEVETRALYQQMGLLDDALREAATAYGEINDPEVRRDALTVVLGLMREGALRPLRGLLFPV